MYRMVEMEDTVRIAPELLAEDQDRVVKDLVNRNFEGRLDKKHGFTVLASDVKRVGDGRVIHGDGAVYQRVRFNALTFKPEVGEVVDGTVCEVVEFGAFVRFGPLDGLLHMSQIMNDYLNVDLAHEQLIGKETKRTLGLNDRVRARLVTVSLNEVSPRESKIGLTMRQPGLGKLEWLEEDRSEGGPKRAGGRGPPPKPRPKDAPAPAEQPKQQGA